MMKKLLLMTACAIVTTMASFADNATAPVITVEPVGNHNVFTPGNYYQEICVFDYKVTATGEGDVRLLLNGIQVPNPCYIPQDYPDWHDDTWYENEVSYCFQAYTVGEDGLMNSSTDESYFVCGIPIFRLTYDEDTESYWMSFSSGTWFRNWNSDYDWQQFSQPFKVWQAPQPLSGGVHVEVIDFGNPSNHYLSSNMGILHDLSTHIATSIFRYSVYEDGLYYPYEYAYDFTPETPYVTLYNYICNKYWMPSEHPACYSGDVVIPNYVEGILDYTFEGCSELTSVFIPASVTSISEQAFKGCTGLDRVEIESLDSWCRIVFCDSLSNPLYFANHLIMDGEEIKNLVFDSWEGFFIDRYAFVGFKGLSSVTCYTYEPPYASMDAFYNLYDQVKLIVPFEALEAYRAHEEWGRFTHIVPFIGAGPGDVNGDYEINIADVTGLIDQLLSGGDIPAYCDVDGDGEVNIKDVTDLIDALLGIR